MNKPTQAQIIEEVVMKIWKCKIGEVLDVPNGSDGPMREAVERAYKEITGQNPQFIFSGWGGELTEPERAVVENGPPLTAAADANLHEDYKNMTASRDRLWGELREVKNRTAAAEVGEPRMSPWDARYSGSAKEIEDHTIERCAQVCKDGTWCGDYYFAKILALKEKP